MYLHTVPLSALLAEPTSPELIPDHRQPDDDADDHALGEGVYVQQHGAVADHGDQEGADERAQDRTLATKEAGPTDNGGSDDVQFQSVAKIRLPGSHT